MLLKSDGYLRRLLILYSLILSLTQLSYSQEYIYNRGLASLSVGVAIPAYDFGMQKGINLSSYAKMGTNISAEVSYYYNWNVGLNFMINYNVNSIDESKLIEGYFDASPAFQTVTAETESFRDISGLIGLVFDVPVNEYASLLFKMMGGLRNVYKPTALVKTTTAFSTINYYETHDNQLVIAFLFSGGGKVKVNDNFNVHVNASYIGSVIDFEYYRNKKLVNEQAHIGILSLSGGVSYAF